MHVLEMMDLTFWIAAEQSERVRRGLSGSALEMSRLMAFSSEGYAPSSAPLLE